MKRLGLAVLVLVWAVTAARAQSEQDTLSVLADQTFQALNSVYVQLPNGTTERVARSQNVGLVAKQYVQQGFAALTLSELDTGWWLIFRNTNEGFDVMIRIHRDANHQVHIDTVIAGAVGGGVWNTSPLTTLGDPCDSTDDNKKCAGEGEIDPNNHFPNGASCDNGSNNYVQNGHVDEYNHPVFENTDNPNDTMVGCSASADGNTVVLSPR